MRSLVGAFALIVSSTAAYAQGVEPEAEDFLSLAAVIAQDSIVTGQWVRLLPTIARQCGMTVDREHVQAVRSRTPPLRTVDRYTHRLDARVKTSWDALARRDLDEACRTADSLWGENGRAFPGVLRDKAEGALQRPVSLAFGAES